MELKSLRIDNNSVYSDMFIRTNTGEMVAMSITGYKNRIDKIQTLLRRKTNLYINNVGATSFMRPYNIYRQEKNDGNVHLVAVLKDATKYDQKTKREKVDLVILTKSDFNGVGPVPEEIQSKFFKKLSKHTPIPLLEEWTGYIFSALRSMDKISYHSSCVVQSENTRAFLISTYVEEIYSIIKKGFDAGVISYPSNGVSARLEEADTLDKYLQAYGPEEFKSEIESKFSPLFDPDRDEFSERTQDVFDYIKYHGIDLYDAQKAIIEAGARNLRKGNSLKIAEQGTGKTVMGVATVYAAMKNDKPTVNMVICPGHLVEKWAAEIEERFPLGKAVIVESFEHFMKDVKPMIEDPMRRHHLFLVISKNTAKNNYSERPNVKYSHFHKGYVCPKCGQVLKKVKKFGKGKNRTEKELPLEEVDFFTKNATSARCKSKVFKYDHKSKRMIETVCGEYLWGANNKNHQTKWLQMPGGAGWVYGPQLHFLELTINAQLDGDKRGERKILKAIESLRKQVEEGTYTGYAPRSYSIAKYLLKHQPLDFLIADELHDYKSEDSDQGVAFGRLCAASKRVLGMTGTLVNGYASSVFYILFRMFPHVMKKNKYDYHDVQSFVEDYGVIRKGYDITPDGHKKSSRPKEVPGVSPHVFTKFLLNHAAFLRMDDVSEGLPSYQEIPIACQMTDRVKDAYHRIERSFSELFGGRAEKGTATMMSNFNPLMTAFPDQPFDQPDVVNPNTNQVYFRPDSIPRTIMNDKEEQTIDIIKEAIADGEKVLVYTTLTNRTDVNERLVELLKEEGIQAGVLLSNTVASRKRAEWIDKKLEKGMQVMICNPTLVETGLDLLPFTSIIFYQIPYNLFTLRQASRRSLRLNQTRGVKVYFMYFEETIQAQAVALMASKQKASQAIEGNFSEEGLNALSETEDMLSAIASNIVAGIEAKVDMEDFLFVEESVDQEPAQVRQVSVRGPEVSHIPHYSLEDILRAMKNKRRKPDPVLKATHAKMHTLFSEKLSVANLY